MKTLRYAAPTVKGLLLDHVYRVWVGPEQGQRRGHDPFFRI